MFLDNVCTSVIFCPEFLLRSPHYWEGHPGSPEIISLFGKVEHKLSIAHNRKNGMKEMNLMSNEMKAHSSN